MNVWKTHALEICQLQLNICFIFIERDKKHTQGLPEGKEVEQD